MKIESDEVEDGSDIAVEATQDTGTTDLSQQHDVAKLQRECPDYKPIFEYIEAGILPQEEKAARKIILESEQFVIDDGTLYHIFHPRTKRMDKIVPIVKQLCIPRILREELMIAYHDNNCHVGQERLYNSLKMKYWFPWMYSTVLQYVASCELCQRTKTSPHRKKGAAEAFRSSRTIWEGAYGFCRSIAADYRGISSHFDCGRQHDIICRSLPD